MMRLSMYDHYIFANWWKWAYTNVLVCIICLNCKKSWNNCKFNLKCNLFISSKRFARKDVNTCQSCFLFWWMREFRKNVEGKRTPTVVVKPLLLVSNPHKHIVSLDSAPLKLHVIKNVKQSLSCFCKVW